MSGEKIKALRLQRGLTLEQVGEIVGVGKSTVRKWESGQIANMRRDKIAKLAEALGVSASQLIMSDEDETEDKWRAREALMRDPARRTLLELAERGTAKDVQQVAALIDALKATNPEFGGDDD